MNFFDDEQNIYLTVDKRKVNIIKLHTYRASQK